MNNPVEIEVEILKSRIDTLEANQKWLQSNWVAWASSTKDMGQKIMIALDQIVNKGNTNSGNKDN